MRSAAVAALALFVALAIAAPHAADRVPVVVELFTSEGCSSCPPADDALATLASTQPVAGAEIIALGEHVDYWDRQGWRDPFSSGAFSARQSEYDASVFRTGSIYTPQLVVDGRDQMVGSDLGRATRAIADAAKRAVRINVTLAYAPDAESRLTVTVQANAAGQPIGHASDVLMAITEDGLVSHVRAGENNGRELHHVAVVRTLGLAGTIGAGESRWSKSIVLRLDPSWRRDRLHVAAFVQERDTRAIVGAAQIPMPKLLVTQRSGRVDP